jgi:hypothetical protein
MQLLLSLLLFIYALPAFAQFQHERIRRITVFPLKVDNKEVEKIAEDVWWDLRERLTESKRFLIASRNFMQAKDVFQPRGPLAPADAIILGRLLDANALVTSYLVDRHFSMRVYETKNGLTLWGGDIDLHPALPISKQLPDAARKLLYDFTASIPYQGFVVVDNLIGRPSYSEGEKLLFKADIGVGTQISVGDTVQLVRMKADKMRPVFQEGASLEVYVEGQVIQVDRQIITVQVVRRAERDNEIRADALVRVPDELRRLKEIYGLSESNDSGLRVNVLENEKELSAEEAIRKPLVTSLSWIGNLALVLLLAF